MTKLIEKLQNSPSRRNPPYRPQARLTDEERADLDRKLGSAANYSTQMLRDLVASAPENSELRKALISAIMSAEFAGIDAFSRKVVEWQEWQVPESLILAMARQTWDEVRHAQLSKGLLESYGGVVGEYPDTLGGGVGGGQAQAQQPAPAAPNGGRRPVAADAGMRNPIVSLSMTNVSLEGGALTLFKGTSDLGRKIDDALMEHCYDYNWADEVTHVAIGDYFVKLLSEGDPRAERLALLAHARHEMTRAGALSEGQLAELKAFFDEEMERAEEALVGGGEAGNAARGYQ